MTNNNMNGMNNNMDRLLMVVQNNTVSVDLFDTVKYFMNGECSANERLNFNKKKTLLTFGGFIEEYPTKEEVNSLGITDFDIVSKLIRLKIKPSDDKLSQKVYKEYSRDFVLEVSEDLHEIENFLYDTLSNIYISYKYDEVSKNRKEENLKVGLIKGRHEIPEVNDFYIYQGDVDPLDVKHIEEVADKFIEEYSDRTIQLYVTGLTIATASVIKSCATRGVKLILMHYDLVNGGYYPQEIF